MTAYGVLAGSYKAAGYTITSGNKAPVLGASSASWTPSGWTSLQNASADDSYVTVSTAFSFNFNSTSYAGFYVGSNLYVTFGSPSTNYSGLGASNPAFNKIMKNAADYSFQRVASIASGTDYIRIRFEGANSTGGTPGASTVIYEMTLFNPTLTGGYTTFEWLLGNDNTIGTGVSGIYSSSALLTGGSWTPAQNNSYIMQATDTNATSWTVYNSYYMANTGY